VAPERREGRLVDKAEIKKALARVKDDAPVESGGLDLTPGAYNVVPPRALPPNPLPAAPPIGPMGAFFTPGMFGSPMMRLPPNPFAQCTPPSQSGKVMGYFDSIQRQQRAAYETMLVQQVRDLMWTNPDLLRSAIGAEIQKPGAAPILKKLWDLIKP
jgi:hypothetical protein